MPVATSIRLARPGRSAPPPARRIFPRTTSSARFGGMSDSISRTDATIIATMCSSALATSRPVTCSTRGLRLATSTPTVSTHPVPASVRPRFIFRFRAALRPMSRPRSALTACTIASSMALPPRRSDSARTRWPLVTTATSVVPPPMSTMNAPDPSAGPRPDPAAAATGSSTSLTLHRGLTAPAATARDRCSTQVAPPGTQITADGRSRPRRRPARRRNPCSMATAPSRSATTPSRRG